MLALLSHPGLSLSTSLCFLFSSLPCKLFLKALRGELILVQIDVNFFDFSRGLLLLNDTYHRSLIAQDLVLETEVDF